MNERLKRVMIIFYLVLLCNTILIAQKKVEVISPSKGEKLLVGTRQGISWISENIDKIDISFSVDNGNSWETIFTNITAEIGVVGWKIPNLVAKDLLIKIEDSNGSSLDVSESLSIIDSGLLIKSLGSNITNQNTNLVIMPLGNSITYDNRVSYNGISPDPRPVGDRTGYRFPLYNLLTSAGYSFSFTGSEHAGENYLITGYDSNAGFPGIKDNQLAYLLKTGRLLMPYYGIDEQITPGPYLNTYPADIILLHIGTNGNNEPDGTDPSDVEEILDEIKRYEDSTKTEITVVIARIINRSPNESFVTTFNDNIETMVLDRVNNPLNDAYPDNIIIVDIESGAGIDYTISEDPNGISGDMNDIYHPNDQGYTKMSQVWFDAIKTVLPKLSVKVFLEGSYLSNQAMSNELNTVSVVPNNQPFNQSPWNYSGKENVSTIPPNIVDWVLVSLRTDINKSSTVVSRAGFVKSDGTIVDLDGNSPLTFPVTESSYYIVVEHRNHLSIMSSLKVLITP